MTQSTWQSLFKFGFTKKVDLLPWLPNSLDVNIIENFQDILDHQVQAQNPQLCSESDLEIALSGVIENLYASLPQWVYEVYHANKGNIGY